MFLSFSLSPGIWTNITIVSKNWVSQFQLLSDEEWDWTMWNPGEIAHWWLFPWDVAHVSGVLENRGCNAGFSSVQFSCSVVSDSLRPYGLEHARPPCPSPTPGVYSNSCPLSQWCHPTISSSVLPFSSRLQSFPASGSFQTSQFFASGGQSIRVSASASVLPMNI